MVDTTSTSLIDDMPAGREVDALVAERVMELRVLGWAPAEPDPMGCPSADYAGYNVPYDGKAKEKHPVYLAHCACEFRDEEDAAILGHTAGCLEVVPFYSTIIMAAWDVLVKLWIKPEVEWIRLDFASDPNYPCYTAAITRSDLGNEVFIGQADIMPLAICRATLKAVGVEDLA